MNFYWLQRKDGSFLHPLKISEFLLVFNYKYFKVVRDYPLPPHFFFLKKNKYHPKKKKYYMCSPIYDVKINYAKKISDKIIKRKFDIYHYISHLIVKSL